MDDDELTITKVVLRPGLDPTGNDNFDMNGWPTESPGEVHSPTAPRHANPENQQLDREWAAFERFLRMPPINQRHPPGDAALLSGGLNNFLWEGTVPVLARRLANSLPGASGPAEFAITELRGVPQTGLDHYVVAKSGNGKPLFGAYVRSARGELCLQQLFEFLQTASNAGFFLPIPTVGAHFTGDYDLDYARLQFFGSVQVLPDILTFPRAPTAGFDPHPSSPVVCAFGERHSATLVAEVPSDGESRDSQDLPLNSATTEDSSGGTPTSSVVSSGDASSYSDCASANQECQEDFSDGLPLSPPPSSLSSRETPAKESPRRSESGPSLQQAQQSVTSASSKDASASSASAQSLPDLCVPWALCALCSLFWGMAGLPERHFETVVAGAPDENAPAILSSEKTAARKRNSVPSRHGPKSKTSGYRGVIFYKKTGKWEADVWHDGVQLYLGAFTTMIHAAQAYDKAALYLHGPDAETNFLPESYQNEYELMQRLTRWQMLNYLRRESRLNGAEVRYPGVAKVKPNLFAASYRPRKEKESKEDIGLFKTEEDALRAVLIEARRREDYEFAAKLLEVHHLRSVRPATEKSNHTRTSISGTGKGQYSSSSEARARNAAIPVSTAALRSEEPGSSAPPPLARAYVQKDLNALGGIIPEELIGAAPVAEDSEGPRSENARASGKRKVSDQPKPSSSAAKRMRGRDPFTRFLLASAEEGESSTFSSLLRGNRSPRYKSTLNTTLTSRPLPIMPSPAALADADIPPPVPVAPMAPAPPPTPASVPTSPVRSVTRAPPARTHRFASLSSNSEWSVSTPAFPAGPQGATLGSRRNQLPCRPCRSCIFKRKAEERAKAEAEAMRQFQKTCDWLLTKRRDDTLHEEELSLAKSPFVIRPVARRLVLARGTRAPPRKPLCSRK